MELKKTESKRAEQNRAAQRAFRQRKELYVKDLENKVNAMEDWSLRIEQLEKENQQLKRHISQLEQQLEMKIPSRSDKTKALDTLDDLVSILKTHRRPPIPPIE